MASKVEKLLLEIKADLKDLSTLKSELKNVRAEAEKSSKSASDALGSIGQVAGAIGAAFAGSKIVGFFRSAVDSANQLEASLSRVESAARSFGQSTAKAKDAALALSKDGFLSLNQSASALSNLLSTGLNIDQSKKFIEAAKNISAFGNTIGDAAGAVESGIKGIITGSTELVENMSPAMKTLSMRFTENKNKVGEAKAVQTLYNDVLKLGTRYAGDAAIYLDTAAAAQKRFEGATETASAAIGKSLQPAFKALYNAATALIEGFTKWFTGLSSSAQSILLIGGAITALIPAVAALIPMVTGLGGAFAGLLANPVILTLVGIAAAITALGVAYANTQPKLSETQNKINEAIALKDQIRQMEKAGATAKDLAAAKAKLAAQEQELINKYAVSLKSLNAQNESMETRLRLIARIEAAERGITGETGGELAGFDVTTLLRMRRETEAELRAASPLPGSSSLGGRALFAPGSSELVSATRADTAASEAGESGIRVASNREAIEARLAAINQALAEANRRTPASGSTGLEEKGKEARFIESQRKLEEIEKNRLFTLKKLEAQLEKEKFVKGTAEYKIELQRRKDAARADANDQAAGEKRRLQQVFAEYIEDETTAKANALEQQKQDAIRASKERLEIELAEAGKNQKKIQEAKESDEKRLQKIREANARKEAQLRLESLNQTLQAANATTSGFAQMLRARDIGSALSGQGSFVSGLSGFKELFPALGALGPIGAGLGAAGGIVSTLSSLLGKSDEERQREAEAQKRRDEEAKAILELQANYQRSMLALQEAAARLPFEDLTRQLRLIDIQAQKSRTEGVDEATIESTRLQSRQTAINNVLSKEAGAISGGRLFSGTEATAEGLTSFLNERASQSGAVALFSQYINTLSDPNISVGRAVKTAKNILSLKGKVPSGLMSAVEASLQELVSFGQGVNDQTLTAEQIRGLQSDASANKGIISDLAKAALRDPSLSSTGRVLNEAPLFVDRANKLVSEINADTTTGENLLSVIEQSLQAQLDIEKHTKATSENTAKLNLLDDRRRSVLDLGNRRIFSQGFNIDFQNLQLPQTIASTILAATPAPVLASDTVSELRKLVAIAEEQAEWLAIIAANTDGRTATNSGDLDNYLIEKLKAIRSRRLS